MAQFQAVDTAIIIAMVLAYIGFTSWLTIRLRSKTVDQFMTAARALPPAVIGILMMSEFVGPNRPSAPRRRLSSPAPPLPGR